MVAVSFERHVLKTPMCEGRPKLIGKLQTDSGTSPNYT
jgi:hypothetical protein